MRLWTGTQDPALVFVRCAIALCIHIGNMELWLQQPGHLWILILWCSIISNIVVHQHDQLCTILVKVGTIRWSIMSNIAVICLLGCC